MHIKTVENYVNQIYSFYGCSGGGSARVKVTLVYLADQGLDLSYPEAVGRFRAEQILGRIGQLYAEARELVTAITALEANSRED